MSRMATYASEEGLARDPNSPKPAEILAQLADILASPSFHGSKRGQQFLEYVCAKSLEGDAGALKERTIAIEVFGRSPELAGHGEDTIVRVGAREVRKRLAQYYVSAEGSVAPILVELPSGSYAPEFRYASAVKESYAASVSSQHPAIVPAVSVEGRKPLVRPGRVWWLTGSAVAALALATILAVRSGPVDPRTRAFNLFWAPVFHSTQPLLIGVGHPIVYQPSLRASLLNEQKHSPSPLPEVRKIELAPELLNGSDMIPILNQFIGFGDMVAANEVSQMMARRSLNVRVLLASSIPFADLRRSPAYLIGSLSNHWTMELGQSWRYQFGWTPEHIPVIKDTRGSGRQWTVPSSDDGSTPEDYSLICRIRNSPTGGLLIISAGVKQFGTEAAGRLLAEPGDLGAILNRLPAGWEERNLQIVLHMKVIGNTPALPDVVASYVW